MTSDSSAHSGSLPLFEPTSADSRSVSASLNERSSSASANVSAFWATNGLTLRAAAAREDNACGV